MIFHVLYQYILITDILTYLEVEDGWNLAARGASNDNGCSNEDQLRGESLGTL